VELSAGLWREEALLVPPGRSGKRLASLVARTRLPRTWLTRLALLPGLTRTWRTRLTGLAWLPRLAWRALLPGLLHLLGQRCLLD
jgi:hypothetical protein